MARKTVGLDFGTSTTLVAVREGESSPRVIPIGDVTPWMPSVLGDDGGRIVVGEDALRLGPRFSLRSIKSLLTKRVEITQVGETPLIVREGVKALVSDAIRRADERLPGIFSGAEVFVGCPALWTGEERRILVDVLHDCGLDVDIGEVVDEPIAAGLHWVNDEWQRSGNRLSGQSLVFDAGGGTLDVAYLEVAGIERPAMTVLSAEGRAESGDALDEVMAAEIRRQILIDSDDPIFLALVREAARTLKELLSETTSATTTLPAPYARQIAFTRPELEEVFAPQLQRAVSLTKSAFAGSMLRVAQPLTPTEIRDLVREWEPLSAEVDHLALVGGLSQVPAVRREIQALFPRSSVVLVERPQESVALGLTFGDRLDELNLPRPPVDFLVTFPEIEDRIDPAWLDSNRIVYGAFSPLYAPGDVLSGRTRLGYEREIPSPPGITRKSDVILRCVMPTRQREPVKLRFKGSGSEPSDGIRLIHDGSTTMKFKLYTNGQFIFSTSHHTVQARVDRWPIRRGPNHNFRHEIELEQVSDYAPSQLVHDDWRFQ